MKFRSRFFLIVLATLVPLVSLRADEAGSRLRAVAQKYAPSIVTVAVVISRGESGDRIELEAEGVIVDASGLIATTNTAIDPSSLRGDSEGDGGAVTNVTGAKILLPEGGEVPARLVLRDKDRNLAFLRPLRPLKLPALPFASAKGVASQGDTVTLLGRLGKAGGRLSSVENARLLAVMKRPRTLYVLPITYLSRLGEVAFNESGQLIGLVSLRVLPSRRASFNQTDQYIAAIVPAADVWAVAR
ncbi:MAG: serine protease, partial [Armatimonadetes bacterium]|nr:serine protease [Armatimonadota bacterium]